MAPNARAIWVGCSCGTGLVTCVLVCDWLLPMHGGQEPAGALGARAETSLGIQDGGQASHQRVKSSITGKPRVASTRDHEIWTRFTLIGWFRLDLLILFVP